MKYLIFFIVVFSKGVFILSKDIESLETNPNSNYIGGAGGIWFDIVAKKSVTISSLSFETTRSTGSTLHVQVYSKEGSHRGFERDVYAWTQIAAVEVTVTNRKDTPLDIVSTHLPSNLFSQFVGKGKTQAFYIHTGALTYGLNFRNDKKDKCVGCVQSEDENIMQLTGNTEQGNGLFGSFNEVRMFNGFVKYSVTPIRPFSFQMKSKLGNYCLEPESMSNNSPVRLQRCSPSNARQYWLADDYGQMISNDESLCLRRKNNKILRLGDCLEVPNSEMKTAFGYEKFSSTMTWLKNGHVMSVINDKAKEGQAVKTLPRDYSSLGGQEWSLVQATSIC